MTLSSLRRLASRGEGPALEFKRSTGELREAMEALCGMLNAQGKGQVLFGVTDKGEIVGQAVAESTQRDIANASRRIEPAASITTSLVRLPSGLSVAVVAARSSAAGPFMFEGRGYLRVGNTTQRMSHSEFERHFVERVEKQIPWDRWIAPGWKIGHLDASEIKRTIEEAIEAKRLTGVLGEKAEVVLRRLELVTARGVTRAAAILFGKEGGPGYPLGEVRLARFRGVTKDEFRDNRLFKGHAFALLKHVERFLDEHVPVASRFVEGQMRRLDTPLYPPLAVREALVNALVHRDYSIDGGAVGVALFDDRLEIWSTGTLAAGLTPEKLRGTHESIPRNRLIADVFHRRGLIEKWGRGTNKILTEAKKHGCPEPEFEEIAGAFVVRFRPAAQAERLQVEPSLGLRAERVVKILHASGPLGAPAILRELGEAITIRSLQTELGRLRKAGMIHASGKGRATTYHLGERSRS
ncbi:MAG: putative DNA binding domain-containing protein [Planctomycetes bacterium]|nr:putative DNA binding domain-containing protein [Planctomycetota bacterium]